MHQSCDDRNKESVDKYKSDKTKSCFWGEHNTSARFI